MSDKSIEFALHDLRNVEQFVSNSSLTNYCEIPDSNGGNYTGGQVYFTNVNLVGSSAGSPYNLPEAIFHYPIQVTASIEGGEFTGQGTVTGPPAVAAIPYALNKFAVTKKGNHHFFHNAWCKLGNVSLEKNNSGYVNMYVNEKKKEKSTIDSISDDIDSVYFDSADSYQYLMTANSPIGELNNYSERSMALNTDLPHLDYNRAIYRRNGNFIDATSVTGYTLPASGLLPAQNNLAQNFQPHFINGTTKLIWNDILVGKLSDLNPAFAKMPPLFHLNGFEVKTQMNAGSNFSVVVTYVANSDTVPKIGKSGTADKNVYFTPASVVSNLGNGQTCPIMLSSASNTGLAGLTFTQTTAGAAVKITLTCTIGWGSTNPAPCRLLIPYHQLDNSALAKLQNNPIYSFYSNNFWVDSSLIGFSSSIPVQRTLATHYRRPRKLYIIPFLSNQNSVASGGTINKIVYPYQSPLSSAPNTCSILKLKNFNILINGKSLFSQQPLFSPTHFYDQNYKYLNSLDYSYDNADRNPLKSGRITKSDFIKGPYGVYVVDICTAVTDEEDEVAQSIGVQWALDSPNGILFDFQLIIETANRFSVDCINGTLVPQDI